MQHDFLDATKDAGALRRELVRKDEHISHLQRSLEQANSVPSVGSWQAVNSPEDSANKKLRDVVDRLQSAYTDLEGQNKLLIDKLGGQDPFVEQLNSALIQKEVEHKAKVSRISEDFSGCIIPWGSMG